MPRLMKPGGSSELDEYCKARPQEVEMAARLRQAEVLSFRSGGPRPDPVARFALIAGELLHSRRSAISSVLITLALASDVLAPGSSPLQPTKDMLQHRNTALMCL